ncbi:DUF6722 family protein [Butyrivibrio sp.]|uniref:DUF6722 family protein n=1 Tax=Butyrivibrio sp. TaxID=28121 RepID=UPI0025C0B631|nr:DUF6722 family protein [Butyrivibrio sp.]MBQ9304329.1 hypothetical protein [Butyrivibrio sp.]
MSTRRERAKEPTARLNKQLEEMEYVRKQESIERSLYLWKSKFLTDLTKLVFAGVLIGGIFQPVSYPGLLYVGGTAFFAIFLLVGYRYYKRAIK